MSSSSTDHPSLTEVIVEIDKLETIVQQLKRMNEPEIVNQLIRKLNIGINPYYPSSAARSFEIEPLEAPPDESGLQVSNVIFKSADEQQPLEEERTNRVGRRQSEKVKQSEGNNIKIPSQYPQPRPRIEQISTKRYDENSDNASKRINNSSFAPNSYQTPSRGQTENPNNKTNVNISPYSVDTVNTPSGDSSISPTRIQTKKNN